MSNSAGITDHRHNDYVGTDANIGRIPGAEKATSGHSYVEIFPKEDPPVQRPDEHLPAPTGRPFAEHAERSGPTERLTTAQSRAPQPLAPAPGSRTVVDADPWAAPTSAADTLRGATSQDVHAGLGVPAAFGMSSAERHRDGRQHRKRGLQGQDQYGTAEQLRGADGVDLEGWREE